MQISAIKAFNTTPVNFQGDKKQKNGMKTAANAVILATALSTAAGCGKLNNVTHNHYLDLPTDTFTQTELKPTPVPPQIIFIETQKPGTDSIIRDTVLLPQDTLFIKEDWKSKVPPKQEEVYDKLGINVTGNGKFFLSEAYYDTKNNYLVNRKLNGQASSRDGNILVYNVVKTKWDNPSEKVVLGKNEIFEKHLVYLSEDGEELGMKILKPKVDIKVSNDNKKSNWQVFTKGTLSTPDGWQDADAFFMNLDGAFVDISNGFKLKPGMKDQSVTTINPHNSEWELIDWNVVKGDAD